MKKMIFTAIAATAATVVGTVSASAVVTQETKPLLKDFAVYAKHDITYSHSDFEGSVGAGGSIKADHFLFNSKKCAKCPSTFTGILVGSDFSLASGKIKVGPVVAGGHVRLSQASNVPASRARPHLLNNKVSDTVADLNQQMDDLSAKALAMPAHDTRILGGQLSLVAYDTVSVFNIDANDLRFLSQLVFVGDEKSTFIINIHGSSVFMESMGIVVGKVKPANILWNIPSATYVSVIYSGTSELAADGRAIGIPGTFVAPNAKVEFNSALITGSIFASSLNGTSSSGFPGGQVNEPELPPVGPGPK